MRDGKGCIEIGFLDAGNTHSTWGEPNIPADLHSLGERRIEEVFGSFKSWIFSHVCMAI